jgi:hypothetical protein
VKENNIQIKSAGRWENVLQENGDAGDVPEWRVKEEESDSMI